MSLRVSRKYSNPGRIVFVLILLFLACAPEDESGYYFDGRVYDAVTGARLTGFDLQLEYLDQRMEASVDSRGRFLVGALEPNHDYTISVVAEGYRPFLSHNQGVEEIEFYQKSLYYDVYLFPEGLKSPSMGIEVYVDDSELRPSGFVRLKPTASSSLYDDAKETPAGVAEQIWNNDEDLQHDTAVKPLVNGVVNILEGDLVYGVSYDLRVYGVVGYQDLEGVTVLAGRDQTKSLTLSAQTNSNLELVYMTTEMGYPSPDGRIVFVFNRPIELDPHQPDSFYAEVLDDNFSIYAPDVDQDDRVNALGTEDVDEFSDRGTGMSLDQNALSFSWDSELSLASVDDDDPILSVIYGGLDYILLRPVGGMENESIALSSVVGESSVAVDVHP